MAGFILHTYVIFWQVVGDDYYFTSTDNKIYITVLKDVER